MATVVVAPHPDDETICCGGLIAKKRSENEEVYVVFMTDGRYGRPRNYASGTSVVDLIKKRKEEAIEALSTLGVPQENAIFLGFEDTRLIFYVDYAAKVLRDLLYRLNPKEIYFPSSVDIHKDHEAASKAVMKAMKGFGNNIKRYQYVVHEPCFRIALTKHLSEHYYNLNVLIKYLKSKSLERYKVILDIRAFKEQKVLAFLKYESQLNAYLLDKVLNRNEEIFYLAK